MTRPRIVAERAATAAIERGCRILRPPRIRDRFVESAEAADRSREPLPA